MEDIFLYKRGRGLGLPCRAHVVRRGIQISCVVLAVGVVKWGQNVGHGERGFLGPQYDKTFFGST